MYGQVAFVCFFVALLSFFFSAAPFQEEENSDVNGSATQKQKAESEEEKKQTAAKIGDNNFYLLTDFLQDFIFISPPLHCHSKEGDKTKTIFTAYQIKKKNVSLFL